MDTNLGELFVKMKFVFLILSICVLTSVCARQQKIDDELVKSGPNLKAPIAFYFKKGTTYEEIESFRENVIGVRHPEGRGYGYINGILGTYTITTQDYKGYVLDEIDEEERENVLKAINSSPLIYRVFENVVPNELVLDPVKAKEEREQIEKANRDNRPTKTIRVTNSNQNN